MDVDYDVAERSIQIQTVHSFFYMILQALGVIRPGEISFLDRYDQFKDEALEYFNSGALITNDVEMLLQSRNCDFSWDFIFVDEGQDWPINEQELLLYLYPYNRFLIADGIDQLTRTPHPANWGDRSRAASTLYFPLRTCLRMKAGLVRFLASFAANLGLVQSNWLANTEIPGGRIIIIEGDYFSSRHFHDSLLTYNQNAGNQPVDTLFCLSPRL